MTIRDSKPQPRILYDANETPHEVFSLAAFCQEHNLNLKGMQNMVQGLVRQHRGWHLDEKRTRRDQERAAAIQAAIENEGIKVRLTPKALEMFGLDEKDAGEVTIKG